MPQKKPRQAEAKHQSVWEMLTPLERKAVKGILSVACIVAVVGGGIARHLNGRIDGLDGRLRGVENNLSAVARDVSRIDRRLDGFENTLGKLQDFLYARPRDKAASLGLQNPSIQLVILRPKAEFTTRTSLASGQTYALRYTILEVTKTSAVVRVDGQFGGINLTDIQVSFPLTPGVPTRIPAVSGPNIPDIYIMVLERPSPDSAIIAVGPKTSQPKKS